MLTYRTTAQVLEILGDDNRWFCSKFYSRPVTEPDTLARYFCENGGAADFAARWDEAMGATNRWFCSERHGYEVNDEQILWEYYTEQQLIISGQAGSKRARSAMLSSF